MEKGRTLAIAPGDLPEILLKYRVEVQQRGRIK